MELESAPITLGRADLDAGLPEILRSPSDDGALALIVRRPATNERETLVEGELDCGLGLCGDNWKTRGSRMTADGTAHPEMQINIMNARVIALIAQRRDRWALAGDQLFLDLDLSERNLPPGTRISLGDAVIEVTAVPHLGCSKFVARFGRDAMEFVNSPEGRALRLRGLNARVVRGGKIRVGDIARKRLESGSTPPI